MRTISLAYGESIVIVNGPAIESDYGALVDASGNLLFGKGATARHKQASTTKYMTGLLACELGDLDAVVTVNSSLFPNPLGTNAGLVNGEQLTLRDLIFGLMFPSGNDAAVVIAAHIAGSVSAFVSLMNAKATTLGLVDTRFANPHGMDATNHYASSLDLAKLALAAQANETFAPILAQRLHYVNGHVWDNLGTGIQRYAGCLASKGGSTPGSLAHAMVAERGGVKVAAAVLQPDGPEQRATDMRLLLDHGLRGKGSATVIASEYMPSYSSGWTRTDYFPDIYTDGFGRYSTTVGAKATYSFVGKKIEVYMPTTNARGIASVRMDGVDDGSIDSYSATRTFSTLVYSKTWPTVGDHVLEITVTGTKNPLSQGTTVAIDKFVIEDEAT